MKIRRSSRSNNGISVYEIESNKLIYSTIIVTIYKGINDDPLLYGGTYHYLEHILGAYFEYNKYGSSYNHLTNMNGSTLNNYLHIYKHFIYDNDTCNYIMDNIINFISLNSLEEFDQNIIDNEKWMVNNETTSKLYDHFLINIFFIYEQIKTGRIYSTFGRNISLDKNVLLDCKRALKCKDYCIYLVNIPSKICNKYKTKLSKIELKSKKIKYEIPIVKTLEGKYILNIKSIHKTMGLILMNLDKELLMYMNISNNDVNYIEYNDIIYTIYVYQDFVYITLSDIFKITNNIQESIKEFIEVFIYFLYISFPMNIDINPISIMHFNSYVKTIPELSYLNKKNLYESFFNFKLNFKPKNYNKFDFILVNTSDDIVDVDQYNSDCNLYFKLTKYTNDVKINLNNIISFINKTNKVEICIDFEKNMIYTNMLTTTNRNVYLLIENNDDDIYGFFAFFIISNCMPYYYIFYNHSKLILNCMFQYEQNIIESNLKSITYRDIYNLIKQLNTNMYDYMNTKNNFFFLINYYLDQVDLTHIYNMEYTKVIGNNYKLTVLNNSKLLVNQFPSLNNKFEHDYKIYNILRTINFDNKYVVIKSKTNDILLSSIFIQYMYELLNKIKSLRKIYMCNFKSSIGNDYYLILIYAQVNDLKQIIIDTYNTFDDIFEDINYNININVIFIILIKLMIFYNIKTFKSKIDLSNLENIKMYIKKEMDKFIKS
jgi:hypothetical protein